MYEHVFTDFFADCVEKSRVFQSCGTKISPTIFPYFIVPNKYLTISYTKAIVITIGLTKYVSIYFLRQPIRLLVHVDDFITSERQN